MQDRKHCPLCDKHGILSYLKSFQINLDEAVLLCENNKCLYPVGLNSPDEVGTFVRPFSCLTGQHGEAALRVPPTHRSTVQLDSLIHRHPAALQENGIGTQTARRLLQNNQKGSNVLNSAPHNGFFSSASTVGIPQKAKLHSKTSLLSVLNSSSSIQPPPTSNGTQKYNLKRASPEFPAFQFGQMIDNGTTITAPSLANTTKALLDDRNEHVFEDYETVDRDLNALFDLVSETENKSFGTKSNTSAKYNDSTEAIKSKKAEIKAAEIPRDLGDVSSHQDPPVSQLFPQWLNKDALCWLDVVLCLMAHNQTLRKLVLGEKAYKNCAMYKLLKASDQAKSILNQLQRNSSLGGGNGSVADKSESLIAKHSSHETKVNQEHSNGIPVEIADTGDVELTVSKPLSAACLVPFEGTKHAADKGLDTVTKETAADKGLKTVAKEQAHDNGLDSVAKEQAADKGLDTVAKDMVRMHGILDDIREEVWGSLKSRLRCEKGRKDSPVFALPLLLQQNPEVEKLFKISYSFRFICDQCHQQEENEYSNIMPTFPSLVDDFAMDEPKHLRDCFRCGSKNGCRMMKYKRLPRCLLMHFVKGLPSNNLSRLQFGFHGNVYAVTGIVQYINNPDHFIAWLRNPKTNQWAKCDDLGTLVCEFEDTVPDLPAEQVHIVMWERQTEHKSVANGNHMVLSKESVINSNGLKGELLSGDRFHVSGGERCNFCGQKVSSVGSQKCEQCSKLLAEASIQNSSIIQPVLCSDGSNTSMCSLPSKSDNANCDFAPVAGLQGTLLESLVSMATGTRDSGAGSSRSSTPCSSLSSFSETSAESLTLPKFTLYSQENNHLLKPVPCKMDVLALQSTGTSSRRMSGCGSNNDSSLENTGAVKSSGTLNKTVDLLRFLKGDKRRLSGSESDKADNKALKVLQNGFRHDWSPTTSSSAFFTAPKSKVKASRSPANAVTSLIKSMTAPRQQAKLSPPKSEKPSGSLCKSESTPALSSKFKLPSYLRKPVGSANLSREGFRTLSRPGIPSSQDGSPLSSTSSSTAGSPAMTGCNSYLSTVKQYLINRTTGTAESKSKFEGLNLRTAPDMKRSTNLSGLVLGSPVASSSVPEIGKNITPPSTKTSKNSVNSQLLQNNKGVKRAFVENITVVKPKFVRKEPTANVANSVENGSEKSSRLRMKSEENRTLNNYGNIRKRGGKNMTLIKAFNENNEKSFMETSNSCDNFVDSMNISSGQTNGGTPKKFSMDSTLEEPHCDTDSVLQDLYEALNIPFKAVPDTMSDIMMDVNDIMGMVDTCKMIHEPALTPNGNGSQSSLGCSMTLMLRKHA